MKNLLAVGAFWAVSLAVTGAGAESSLCTAAQEKLENYLQSQPKTCEQNSDCAGYFYRADGCKPAVILPRNHETPDFSKALEALQGEVRNACAADWATRGPCSPQPFVAACVNKVCK